MRSTSIRLLSSFICCLLLATAGGCKKKGGGKDQAGLSDSTLPGSSEVIAAANAKDYTKAMQLWADIRGKVSTEEQVTQLTILTSELKSKLLEAPSTDTKAAEGLSLLRATTLGR